MNTLFPSEEVKGGQAVYKEDNFEQVFTNLTPKSLELLDYFLEEGYPLPDVLTNLSIRNEWVKNHELENYARNNLL